MQKPMISVRRRSTLAQTIRTENWLRDMAQKGFFLRQLSGTNYRFEQGEPRDVRYFLMSPEIGSNSDSWVFYEFERKMGKRIPCEGKSFVGPSHVLAVDGEAADCVRPRSQRIITSIVIIACSKGFSATLLAPRSYSCWALHAILSEHRPFFRICLAVRLRVCISCFRFSASARTAYPPEHPDRCRNLHAPLIEMPVRQHCRRRGANEKISYYKILF